MPREGPSRISGQNLSSTVGVGFHGALDGNDTYITFGTQVALAARQTTLAKYRKSAFVFPEA